MLKSAISGKSVVSDFSGGQQAGKQLRFSLAASERSFPTRYGEAGTSKYGALTSGKHFILLNRQVHCQEFSDRKPGGMTPVVVTVGQLNLGDDRFLLPFGPSVVHANGMAYVGSPTSNFSNILSSGLTESLGIPQTC